MNYDDLNAQFEALIATEQFDQAETLLEAHTALLPEEQRSMPFQAPVILKGVQGQDATAPEFESAGIINAVTGMARRLRNGRYKSAIRRDPGSIRILEEGDSWHQYPVFLQDVIDHVARSYPVYSLSAPGDLVTDMALRGEHLTAIATHQPDVFMLSGGGNDLLGAGRLTRVLKDHFDGASAAALINETALNAAVESVMAAYRQIVSSALGQKPDLHIMVHGYDDPIPTKQGKWLGGPLANRGIPLALGRKVVALILDRFNRALKTFSSQTSRQVHYVDLRGKVGASTASWLDELHPKSTGFGKCAKVILGKIDKLQIKPRTPGVAEMAAMAGQAEATNVSLSGLLNGGSSPNAQLRMRDHLRTYKPHENVLENAQDEAELEAAQRTLARLVSDYDEPEKHELIKNRLDYSLRPGRHSFEAIIGQNNFDDFYVLSLGVRVGASVCRIHARGVGGGSSYGTGFLIGGGLLMTNNHVLPDKDTAAGSIASFSYEYNEDGTPGDPSHFRLTGELFMTSRALDFTIVSVADVSTDETNLADFGHIEMLPRSGKALKREFVNIVQHPAGDYKKVALRENLVVGRADQHLYYVTDTLPGASGSPVMNEEWQLAAIHHMAIPSKDKPGTYWANRGVRISSILQDITERATTGQGDAARIHRILEEVRGRPLPIPPYQNKPVQQPVPQDDISEVLPFEPEDVDDDWAENIDHTEQDPGLALQPEAARPRLPASAAQWPGSHRNAPDTWHLPGQFADASFDLDAGLLGRLIEANRFTPVSGPSGALIFALRGCRLAGGVDYLEGQRQLPLRTAVVDHENFRCVMGVWDRNAGTVSAYTASTVPRRTGMKRYYDFKNFGGRLVLANLLPTGCYEYCVGTHQSSRQGAIKYILRQGNGPDPQDRSTATTLRTYNDLTYGTRDFWDMTRPADNIHPAFLRHSFSSQGCLTLPGTQSGGGASHTTGTGLWSRFRRQAGFNGQHYRARYDVVLLTGHEAAAAQSGDPTALTCLRHGSSGPEVARMQAALVVASDGNFGPATKKALTDRQTAVLGYATGSYGPEMAALMGWAF